MDDEEEYVNQEKDFIKKLPIRKSSDFYTYFREIYEEEQMKMTPTLKQTEMRHRTNQYKWEWDSYQFDGTISIFSAIAKR